MKIDPRSLEFANHSVGNRPLPIPFYIPEKKEELKSSDYQVYKLWTNPKDKKSAVYSLMVKYYKAIKGQDIQDLEAAYTLIKSLLQGDALQVFQNKELVQKERDSPVFTKFLGAVTKHIFPTKAYKLQKKCICNILKTLRLGPVNFPMLEGLEATTFLQEEFVDILEDGIPLQWKLEFEKE
eukprot:15325622-Ditylum_brightwellii.AAC.1